MPTDALSYRGYCFIALPFSPTGSVGLAVMEITRTRVKVEARYVPAGDSAGAVEKHSFLVSRLSTVQDLLNKCREAVGIKGETPVRLRR